MTDLREKAQALVTLLQEPPTHRAYTEGDWKRCGYCHEPIENEVFNHKHADSCRWLALGKIASELEAVLSSESPPDVEDVCECGHLRSEHVMGKNYCSKGCYTTEEQAEYFRVNDVPGFGERPTCLRFTVASQPEGKP